MVSLDRRINALEHKQEKGMDLAAVLMEGNPLTAEQARGLIASILAALLLGTIDPATARTAAQLLQVERKIAESEEFERRMEVLEEMLGLPEKGEKWRR